MEEPLESLSISMQTTQYPKVFRKAIDKDTEKTVPELVILST